MHKQSKIRNSYPPCHQQVFITCKEQGSFTCSGFYTEDKCHHSKCPCSPPICGMGYLFGQLGLAVLTVSSPDLLTGTVLLEARRTLALCNHCSATAKTFVCFQCWFAYKSWAYVRISFLWENILCPSRNQYKLCPQATPHPQFHTVHMLRSHVIQTFLLSSPPRHHFLSFDVCTDPSCRDHPCKMPTNVHWVHSAMT